MKKILFLAPAKNYHTRKWCSYFMNEGYEVYVISLTSGNISGAIIHSILPSDKSEKSDFSKIEYLFLIRRINKLYKNINPDIVSVHYATSYGLLAALSSIKRYSLSVWGTDVYAFPLKSFLHKKIVEYSLKKATILLSTSKAMAEECKKYTSRKFYITPFGVDMQLFKPQIKKNNPSDKFVICTIKSLSPEYGIDILLKAIKHIKENNPHILVKVYIAGEGPSTCYLRNLSKIFDIEDRVVWLGLISQNEVIKILNKSDIAVIPSFRESFGVSAVEAQACGLPVVISDVEGLKEATKPGITSITFNPGNYKELAKVIETLYNDKKKRYLMGRYARDFVVKNFEYKSCFKKIERILCEL